MTPSLSSVLTTSFPPNPTFTEKDVPDLGGKVYIFTGANAGVGKELSRTLYSKNGKVYVTARTKEKAKLSTIKASAETFTSAESRLHVLFNNAGYVGPENGVEQTPQGYEMHFGVDCVGPFLFTKLLTPTLVVTARDTATAPGTNTTSIVDMDNLEFHANKAAKSHYGTSKGAVFGSLTSPMKHPVVNGAYTELWAGLSPEVTLEKAGGLVYPFGCFGPIRKDWTEGTKSSDEGGNGTALRF
ncbi:short-chain dehydrogenase [Diaporthe eres]|nr:short-chain dehydrogenase [Diaporthe eres]